MNDPEIDSKTEDEPGGSGISNQFPLPVMELDSGVSGIGNLFPMPLIDQDSGVSGIGNQILKELDPGTRPSSGEMSLDSRGTDNHLGLSPPREFAGTRTGIISSGVELDSRDAGTRMTSAGLEHWGAEAGGGIEPVSGPGMTDDREYNPAVSSRRAEDEAEEWSPGTEQEEEDEPEANYDVNDPNDENYEYSESEYTDYENDNVVQYQAAIDAGLVDDERQCWVCFASDEDDPTATWVHPCRCSGTTKWVHHVCIQRWVDEKQKGNNTAGVSCPQCGTDYRIKFPPSGPIMKVMDAGDLLVGRVCPMVAGGVLVGGIYWSCVTFGAVTIMQVAGHEEGWHLMEAADPLLLLVSLPLVPLGLVLGKMIKWQDPVLKVLRLYLPRIPVTRYLLPAFSTEPTREGSGAAASIPPSTDHVSLSRTFCGALFFPTIATFLGSTVYQETTSPFKRALLGGLTFVVLKGVLKVYHKQHLYIRQCQREILDYEPKS